MGVLLCPLCRGEPIRWESQLGHACCGVFAVHVHVAVTAVCRQARCQRRDSCCTFGVCRLFYLCCQYRRAAAGPKSAVTQRMMTTILVSSHLPCRSNTSHMTPQSHIDHRPINDFYLWWCLSCFLFRKWMSFSSRMTAESLCSWSQRSVSTSWTASTRPMPCSTWCGGIQPARRFSPWWHPSVTRWWFSIGSWCQKSGTNTYNWLSICISAEF